jgi:hypothetical protein
VRQIVYTQELTGRLTAVAPGLMDASLAAPAEPATADLQLTFSDEHSFRVSGQLRFADGDVLCFRTRESGRLDAAELGLRHGTAVLEVCGGSGRFAGARGRITSNFVVSDGGEITDHQLGVVFVATHPKEQA